MGTRFLPPEERQIVNIVNIGESKMVELRQYENLVEKASWRRVLIVPLRSSIIMNTLITEDLFQHKTSCLLPNLFPRWTQIPRQPHYMDRYTVFVTLFWRD